MRDPGAEQHRPGRPEALSRGAVRGGEGSGGSRGHPGALGRPAPARVRAFPQGRRPRRGGSEQHPGGHAVEAAWSLPSQVRKAASVDEVLKQSHFVSLHVPLGEKTRHMIDARNIDHFRAGAVLLNFSRDGVVADDAVVKALNGHRLKWYVTDFPSAGLLGHAGVIALPHLGASTREAEDNSAIMV